MKKKSLLIVALAALMVLSLVFAAGCNNVKLTDLQVKDGTFKTEYIVGDTIDYTTLILKLTYSDGATKEMSLKEAKATYTPVTTDAAGEKTLTITVEGKTVNVTINVSVAEQPKVSIETFGLPKSYADYKSRSAASSEPEDKDDFRISDRVYKVGAVNKFEFVPIATGFDAEDNEITVTDVKTTVKIYQKAAAGGAYAPIAEADVADFVNVQNNMYKFTDDAVDKFVKIEVSLDTEEYDTTLTENARVLTAEFQVVDAYNAYDTMGLSVVDNLNVKNWASLKDRTLKWDDKKLAEYTDVSLVILHGDIEIDPDLLPANYFWTEETPSIGAARSLLEASNPDLGYEDKLVGSLRDWDAGDGVPGSCYRFDTDSNTAMRESWALINMQKGLFNTDRCSVTGNYMTITLGDSDTHHLYSVLCSDAVNGDQKSLDNPIAHWYIFKFYKQENQGKLNVTVDNLSMKGNMTRKQTTDGEPAGMECLNTLVDTLTLDNVIMTQFYTHIVNDASEGRAELNLNVANSKFYEAYSNMIYLWRSKANITNSVMKDAGGPLFIMCDSNRLPGENLGNDNDGPVLTIDTNTELEALASGQESWYGIFNATALFTQLKGMSMLTSEYLGKTFVSKTGTGAAEVELVNVIAVIIPDPGAITEPHSPAYQICGKFTRGEDTIAMADQVFKAVKTMNTVMFLSKGHYAVMASPTTLGDPMQGDTATWAAGWKNDSSDLLGIYMNAGIASGSNTFPYFAAILGNFNAVQA